MSVMALDLGEKRIGIAVSDPLGVIATGLPTLERKDFEQDLDHIQKIVKNKNVHIIVLGFPLHLDGRKGKEADAVLKFKEILQDRTGLPVDLIDERWTTVQAEKILLEANLSRAKRKTKRDQVSAQIMLQAYLERKG